MASTNRPAFLSYAREDTDFAVRLASDLKTAGMSVWVDNVNIRPGHQWDLEVQKALTNSDEVLVVLSPKSVKSRNVLDEIAFALDQGKRVLPLVKEDCEMPFRLLRLQYIDFRSQYRVGLANLVAGLASHERLEESIGGGMDIDSGPRSDSGRGVAVADQSRSVRENVSDSRKPIGHDDGRPWPANFVPFPNLPLDFASQLQQIIESAVDERPIQKWLEANPAALVLHLGTTSGWLFGRPKLGAEFVPDFMFCSWDSRGYRWSLVELENPNFASITREGSQTARLTHAVQQVLDWRIWLRANIQYAQHQLGFRDLDDGFRAHIMIGRRKEMDERERLRYRELSRDGLEVLTYDRLVESVARNRSLSS